MLCVCQRFCEQLNPKVRRLLLRLMFLIVTHTLFSSIVDLDSDEVIEFVNEVIDRFEADGWVLKPKALSQIIRVQVSRRRRRRRVHSPLDVTRVTNPGVCSIYTGARKMRACGSTVLSNNFNSKFKRRC